MRTPTFLASCETDAEGEWQLTGLPNPAFVLVKKLNATQTRETFLIRASDVSEFKTNEQIWSYAGPNSLDPKSFLTSKNLNPAQYRMAVVTVVSQPIASMPDPQAGSNMRHEVRNNGAPVLGQLFRSDNAGSWQDTWALQDGFTWGNANTLVKHNPAVSMPGDPAAWAEEAKAQAPGGAYIQYSFSFGPV